VLRGRYDARLPLSERSSIRRSDRWSLLTLPPGAPPEVTPHDLGEPDPGRDLLRQAAVAFDGQRPAGRSRGSGRIDGNEGSRDPPRRITQIDRQSPDPSRIHRHPCA